jgi:hypothetical protein
MDNHFFKDERSKYMVVVTTSSIVVISFPLSDLCICIVEASIDPIYSSFGGDSHIETKLKQFVGAIMDNGENPTISPLMVI